MGCGWRLVIVHPIGDIDDLPVAIKSKIEQTKPRLCGGFLIACLQAIAHIGSPMYKCALAGCRGAAPDQGHRVLCDLAYVKPAYSSDKNKVFIYRGCQKGFPFNSLLPPTARPPEGSCGTIGKRRIAARPFLFPIAPWGN